MQQDLMPGLGLGRGAPRSEQIKIHGADAFDGMRPAGMLAAATLDFIMPHVRAGITTGELDRLCHEFIVGHEAIPAPLNYRGFPKSICTSINHVVCHGIPGDRRLMDGDILNIDVRSEEHTSELQSLRHLVCRLLLEKKKMISPSTTSSL